MTYGDKYALMKAYKISTGEDPDQTASADINYSQKTVTCSGCGGNITSVMKKDGNMWGAAEIVQYSQRRFGKVLCPDCQRAAMKNEN